MNEADQQKARWAGYRSARFRQLAHDLKIPEPADFPAEATAVREELQANALRLAALTDDYAASLQADA